MIHRVNKAMTARGDLGTLLVSWDGHLVNLLIYSKLLYYIFSIINPGYVHGLYQKFMTRYDMLS